MHTDYWWENLLQCEHTENGGCHTQMSWIWDKNPLSFAQQIQIKKFFISLKI